MRYARPVIALLCLAQMNVVTADAPPSLAFPDGTYLRDELIADLSGCIGGGCIDSLSNYIGQALVPPVDVEYISGSRYRILLPSSVDDSAVRQFLHENTDYQYHYVRQQQANDPLYGTQWNIAYDGVSPIAGFTGTPASATGLQMESAWTLQSNANGVVVAVLDSGFDVNHEDLAGVFLPGRAFTADGPAGSDVSAAPGDSHGTAIAGIIAANTDNNIGIAGIAPGAQILPVKIDFSIRSIVEGAGWAFDNGAHVIVLPFAGPQFSDWERDTLEHLASYPVTFVAAAGNQGVALSDATGPFPAAYANTRLVRVAANDPQNLLAPFSNWDPALVEVAAPGVAITTTLEGDRYGMVEGTSFAAAHAAGVIALLYARNENLWFRNVVNSILGGANIEPETPAASVADDTRGRTQAGIIDPARLLTDAVFPLWLTRVETVATEEDRFSMKMCYELVGSTPPLTVQFALAQSNANVSVLDPGPMGAGTAYGENCVSTELQADPAAYWDEVLVQAEFSSDEGSVRRFVRVPLAPLHNAGETSDTFTVGAHRFDHYRLHRFRSDEPIDIASVSVNSASPAALEVVLWSMREHGPLIRFLRDPAGLTFVQGAEKFEADSLHLSIDVTQDGTLAATNEYADMPYASAHAALVLNKSGTPVDYTLTFEKVGQRGTFALEPLRIFVEGEPEALVDVHRNGHAGAVSVDYRTAPVPYDNPAKAGQHYVETSGTLHWNDGETAPKRIAIPLLDDRVVDNQKQFDIVLENPTGGATLKDVAEGETSIRHFVAVNEDDNYGRVVGRNPDGPHRIEKGAIVVDEGVENLVFSLERIGGDAGKVTATWTIESSNAVEGIDYEVLADEIVWEDYETGPRPFLRILDNQRYAGDRELEIIATAAYPDPDWLYADARIGFYVTIVEDEAEPSEGGAPSGDEGGSGGGAAFWLLPALLASRLRRFQRR